MNRYVLLAALGLCLAIGVARSDEEATARLVAHLNTVDQLAGQFNQSRRAGAGEEGLSRTSGNFRLLRPSYFAWDIETPDHQLVLADGEYLWHYDRDLETVTRRPLASQGQSPLQVLAGDNDVLRRSYAVSATGRGRFLLEPLEEGAAFRQLTLIFNDDTLQGMEILDNLGQLLLVEFTGVDTHPGLTPADFSFEPPAGVDLFYHDE